jgi:hypothetical protein
MVMEQKQRWVQEVVVVDACMLARTLHGEAAAQNERSLAVQRLHSNWGPPNMLQSTDKTLDTSFCTATMLYIPLKYEQ